MHTLQLDVNKFCNDHSFAAILKRVYTCSCEKDEQIIEGNRNVAVIVSQEVSEQLPSSMGFNLPYDCASAGSKGVTDSGFGENGVG